MRSPESPEVKLMSRQCDIKARCSQGNTREAPEGFDLLSVISSSLLFCLLSSSCACQDETLPGSCCTCVSATSDTCVSEGCPFFFPSCFSACLAPFDFSAKGTHNASPSLCEQVEQDQQLQCQTRNSSITTSGCDRKQKCAQKRCSRVDRTETRQSFAKEKKTQRRERVQGYRFFAATPNFRKREKRKGEKGHRGTDFSRQTPFRTARREIHPKDAKFSQKRKNAKPRKGTGVQIFRARRLFAPPGGRTTRKTPNFRKRDKRRGEKRHRGTDFSRQMSFRTARRTKHPKDAKFSQKKKTQRRKRAQGYRFFTPNAFSHRPADETPERRQIFAKEKNAKAKNRNAKENNVV